MTQQRLVVRLNRAALSVVQYLPLSARRSSGLRGHVPQATAVLLLDQASLDRVVGTSGVIGGAS